MDNIQAMLAEFHEKHAQGPSDFTREMQFKRALWTMQESWELWQATFDDDKVATADALADIVYLCYGSAHRLGIDLTACLEEVHRSNMTKDIGPDGKAVKGPSYEPPNIAAVIGND